MLRNEHGPVVKT